MISLDDRLVVDVFKLTIKPEVFHVASGSAVQRFSGSAVVNAPALEPMENRCLFSSDPFQGFAKVDTFDVNLASNQVKQSNVNLTKDSIYKIQVSGTGTVQTTNQNESRQGDAEYVQKIWMDQNNLVHINPDKWVTGGGAGEWGLAVGLGAQPTDIDFGPYQSNHTYVTDLGPSANSQKFGAIYRDPANTYQSDNNGNLTVELYEEIKVQKATLKASATNEIDDAYQHPMFIQVNGQRNLDLTIEVSGALENIWNQNIGSQVRWALVNGSSIVGQGTFSSGLTVQVPIEFNRSGDAMEKDWTIKLGADTNGNNQLESSEMTQDFDLEIGTVTQDGWNRANNDPNVQFGSQVGPVLWREQWSGYDRISRYEYYSNWIADKQGVGVTSGANQAVDFTFTYQESSDTTLSVEVGGALNQISVSTGWSWSQGSTTGVEVGGSLPARVGVTYWIVPLTEVITERYVEGKVAPGTTAIYQYDFINHTSEYAMGASVSFAVFMQEA